VWDQSLECLKNYFFGSILVGHMLVLNMQTPIIDSALHNLYNFNNDIVNFILLMHGGKV
jgi:hypothetical protein